MTYSEKKKSNQLDSSWCSATFETFDGGNGIYMSWKYKDFLHTTGSMSLWDQDFNDFIRKCINDVWQSNLVWEPCSATGFGK